MADDSIKIPVSVDTSGAKKELNSFISKAKGETVNIDTDVQKPDFKPITKEAEKAGKDAGEGFGSGFGLAAKAGLAAGGVIAAVAGLKAAFDFTKETNAMRKQVAIFSGAAGTDLTNLTAKVQAISKVFDKDFNETLQSTNAMAKGFGVSFEEATSIMEQGFLAGADATDELLAVTREYPVLLKEVGLDASEAMAVLTQQVTSGVFSDKGIDAIKEAGLKLREMTPATKDAINAIGLSSDAITRGISDGSLTAFEAMQQVSEKLKDTELTSVQVGTALADIFGGAGEDAGLAYIQSLSDMNLNMDDLVEKNGAFNEQQETMLAIEEKLSIASQGLAEILAPLFSGLLDTIVTYLLPVLTVLLNNLDLIAIIGGTVVAVYAAAAIQAGLAAISTSAFGVAVAGSAGAMKIVTAAQWLWNAAMAANPVGAVLAVVVALAAAIYLLANAFGESAEEALANNVIQGELIDTQIKATAESKKQEEGNLELLKSYKKLGEEQKETGIVTQEYRDLQLDLMETYPGIVDSSKSYEENLKAISVATSGNVLETDKLTTANQDLVKEYIQLAEKSIESGENQDGLKESIEEINKVYPGAITGVENYHDEIKTLEIRAGLSSIAIGELDTKARELNKQKKSNTLTGFRAQIQVSREKISDLDADLKDLFNRPGGDFQDLIGPGSVEKSQQAAENLLSTMNKYLARKRTARWGSADVIDAEVYNAGKAELLVLLDAEIALKNAQGIFSKKQIAEQKAAELDAAQVIKDDKDKKAKDDKDAADKLAKENARRNKANQRTLNEQLKDSLKEMLKLREAGEEKSPEYEKELLNAADLTAQLKAQSDARKIINAEVATYGKTVVEDEKKQLSLKEQLDKVLKTMLEMQLAGEKGSDAYIAEASNAHNLLGKIEELSKATKQVTEDAENYGKVELPEPELPEFAPGFAGALKSSNTALGDFYADYTKITDAITKKTELSFETAAELLQTTTALFSSLGHNMAAAFEDGGKGIILMLIQITEAVINAAIAQSAALSLAQPDSIATGGLTGIIRAAAMYTLITSFTSALLQSLISGADEGVVGITSAYNKKPSGADSRLIMIGEQESVITKKGTLAPGNREALEYINSGRSINDYEGISNTFIGADGIIKSAARIGSINNDLRTRDVYEKQKIDIMSRILIANEKTNKILESENQRPVQNTNIYQSASKKIVKRELSYRM